MPLSKMHSVSGSSDPRTATTLILFEEFVPVEYRQQLQASGSSRRRLPSLFGTSSKRQWKPAQTLNGRPYVIGHVPHSPSYREVEFEGILRSNESSTKMLSLKTADKLPPVSIKSPPAGSPISNFTATPVQEKPNLFLSPVAAVDAPLQRPSSRSSDNHDPTPTSSPNMNRKSGRFRIPGTPVGSRTAGIPPAEYENVDFEARLASFDDDELVGATSGSSSRHRKQRMNDDAWVDILVANNGRRMDSQDAVLRSGLNPGRSDPDLASQELSEVLAAVRAHPLSDDEDNISELVPVTEDGSSQRGTYLEDYEGERSTVHGRESDLYPDEEEDDREPRGKPAPRRLGYFDLHPERRLGRVDVPSTRPTLQVPASPGLSVEGTEESTYSEHDDAYDATQPLNPLPSNLLVPPRVPTEPSQRPASPSRTGNGHVVPSVAVSPPPGEAPRPSQSKTSTLIEMYRERERNNNSTSPAPPSKLPVRTGSLPSGPLGARPMPTGLTGARPMPAAPIPRPVSPTGSPAKSAVSIDIDDASFEEAIHPKGYSSSGIATPPRYVHGAPLHNVMEEEEEEY